jgi:hypothetical protein
LAAEISIHSRGQQSVAEDKYLLVNEREKRR